MERTPLKEKFIQLRVQGISLSKISELIKVSKPTLINWSKDFSLEIENLKAIEIERIKKEFCFSNQENIEYLLMISQKIDKELANRDYAQISTEKLLSLSLNLKSQIHNISQVRFKHNVVTSLCSWDDESQVETIID